MTKYVIHFKDIDPDTGDVSQTAVLAVSEQISNANWIRIALEHEWFSDHGANDPNREFYITELNDMK